MSAGAERHVAAFLKYPSHHDRAAARRIHAMPRGLVDPWTVTALCGAGVVAPARGSTFDPAHADACPHCAERVRTGAGPAR